MVSSTTWDIRARGPTSWTRLLGKYSRAEDRPFLPSEDPAFDVLYALSPLRAASWRLDDYDNTQARWARGNDAR